MEDNSSQRPILQVLDSVSHGGISNRPAHRCLKGKKQIITNVLLLIISTAFVVYVLHGVYKTNEPQAKPQHSQSNQALALSDKDGNSSSTEQELGGHVAKASTPQNTPKIMTEEKSSPREKPDRETIVSSKNSTLADESRTVKSSNCDQHEQSQHYFPNIDYAFYGYNILKGFPLASGHDPGFTYPIFQADYADSIYTGDCRYRVPRGLVVIPEVACDGSFSSKIIRNANDLTDFLDDLTGAYGSLKGLFYAINSDYKDMISALLTKKREYIMSQASCNYYFSKLLTTGTRTFHTGFLPWIQKLNAATDFNTYFNFFETFGTHFPIETTFGARIAYRDTVKLSESRSNGMGEEKLKDSVAAFYTDLLRGRVSVVIAKGVKNPIVATQTYTVGSPPLEKDDSRNWASAVQLNPAPSKFRLASIEHLFSRNYMKGLRANFSQIHDRIVKFKPNYFSFLTMKDFCLNDRPQYLKMKGFHIFSNLNYVVNVSLDECIRACHEKMSCDMISHHVGHGTPPKRKCFMHRKRQNSSEFLKRIPSASWNTRLMFDKSPRTINLDRVQPWGYKPMKIYDGQMETSNECRQRCDADLNCFGSWFRATDGTSACQLYDHKILSADFVYDRHVNGSLYIQNRCFDLVRQKDI